ncbi:MAG: lipid-binding protein, partial [Sphingobacteriales bacterium]
MKLRIILLVFFCLAGIGLKASTTWELKKETDGIKVYTGRLPQMHIKAVKVECTVNATMSQLTALLLDAKAHEDWVYSTKTSYLVKRINAANLQYYSEMSMP